MVVIFRARLKLYLFFSALISMSLFCSEKDKSIKDLMHEQKYETMTQNAEKDFADAKVRRGIGIYHDLMPVLRNLVFEYTGLSNIRFAKVNSLDFEHPVTHMGVRKDGTIEVGSKDCSSVGVFDLNKSKGKERIGTEKKRLVYQFEKRNHYHWNLPELPFNLYAAEGIKIDRSHAELPYEMCVIVGLEKITYINSSREQGKQNTVIDLGSPIHWTGRLSNGYFVVGCDYGLVIYDFLCADAPKEIAKINIVGGSCVGSVLSRDRILSCSSVVNGTNFIHDSKSLLDPKCFVSADCFRLDDGMGIASEIIVDKDRVVISCTSACYDPHGPSPANNFLQVFDYPVGKRHEVIERLKYNKTEILCFITLNANTILVGTENNKKGCVDVWQEVPNHVEMLVQKYEALWNKEAKDQELQECQAIVFHHDHIRQKVVKACSEIAQRQKQEGQLLGLAKIHNNERLEAKCLKLWQQKTKEQELLEKELNKKAEPFCAWYSTRNALNCKRTAFSTWKKQTLEKLRIKDEQEQIQLKKFTEYRAQKKASALKWRTIKDYCACGLMGAAAGLAIYKVGMRWVNSAAAAA